MGHSLTLGRITLRCLCCEHPVSALSVEAAQAAMDAHVRYVNSRLDRATDVHFEEHRLDALIQA